MNTKVVISFPTYSSYVVDAKGAEQMLKIFSTAEVYTTDYIDGKSIASILPVQSDVSMLTISPITPVQYQMARMAGDKKAEEEEAK